MQIDVSNRIANSLSSCVVLGSPWRVLLTLWAKQVDCSTLCSTVVRVVDWQSRGCKFKTGLPPYLAQQLCPYAPTRALCPSTSKLLQVIRTKLRFGSRSFHVSAPALWNSLPHSIRFPEYLTTFRKCLKTFLFSCDILLCPLSTHCCSASDSILDFWRSVNSFTYVHTYLLIHCGSCVVVILWFNLTGI